MSDYILEMRHITKEFPGVKALNDVNFKVKRGEIHCLVGENGAGKSTLMKVLSGVHKYGTYTGDIVYNGEVQQFKGIADSEAKEIAIIYQELALVPELSIYENIYFGHEIMQRYFGLNVWVKSLKNNDTRYPVSYNDTNYYQIFTDAKFPSEITYIKDNNGVVVKVNRPSHKKKGNDRLKNDDRYDYEVNIGESLVDLANPIFDIALDIINKNIKNGKENE